MKEMNLVVMLLSLLSLLAFSAIATALAISFWAPPYFVSADDKIDSLLRGFQVKKLHQAIVLDKKSKIIGLITLEDILEELVGSIQDEHDLS